MAQQIQIQIQTQTSTVDIVQFVQSYFHCDFEYM